MKNILIAIFMLIVFVAGTVIAAAIYFTVTYGALGWLAGTSATRLGEAVGSAAGALGFPVGAVVFGITFWDRLVHDDGRPDYLARAVAVIIALPLALVPFFTLIMTALATASQFKALGILALAGFLGIIGWVEQKLRSGT